MKAPVFTIALMFFLLACKPEEETVPDYNPELPALSTFQLDQSLFTDTDGMTSSESLRHNWDFTDSLAAYWFQDKLTLIEFPSQALEAVLRDDKPFYYNERQAFLWTVDFIYKSAPYQAELSARPEGDHVLWEMWIFPEGGEAFRWFEGQTAQDFSSAVWWLYGSSASTEAQLKINYNLAQDSSWFITYTSLQDNNYISYSTAKFDSLSTYKLYFAAQDQLYHIDWNVFTYQGRLTLPDGGTLCWEDSSREDIDCEKLYFSN
jgi:hypothetical protein